MLCLNARKINLISTLENEMYHICIKVNLLCTYELIIATLNYFIYYL